MKYTHRIFRLFAFSLVVMLASTSFLHANASEGSVESGQDRNLHAAIQNNSSIPFYVLPPEQLYADESGNLLNNGAFETTYANGMPFGWTVFRGKRTVDTLGHDDKNNLELRIGASEGQGNELVLQNIKHSTQGQVVRCRQDFYHIKPQTTYHLQGEIFATQYAMARLSIKKQYGISTFGHMYKQFKGEAIPADGWKKVDITFTTSSFVDPWTFVSVVCELEGGTGTARFRQLRLTDAKSPQGHPAKTTKTFPCNVMLSVHNGENIFYPTQVPKMVAIIANSGSPRDVALHHTVYDPYGSPVDRGVQTVRLLENTIEHIVLDLPANSTRGQYMVVVNVQQDGAIRRNSLAYYVISEPQEPQNIEADFFGMHQPIAPLVWEKLKLFWDGPAFKLKLLKRKEDSKVQAFVPGYATHHFGLLMHTPSWAITRDGHGPKAIPEKVTQLVRETLTAYKGRQFFAMSMLGEIERQWDPVRYVEFLKAARKGADQSNSEIHLATCVPASLPRCIDYLEKIIEAGALKYVDIVACDPYTNSRSPEERNWTKQFEHISQLIDKHGKKNTEIWIYEVGLAGGDGLAEVSLDKQANYMARIHLLSLQNPKIKRLLWFMDRVGYASGSRYGMSAWGENTSPNALRGFAVRPAFIAYAQMLNTLRNAKYLEAVPFGPSYAGHKAMLFKQGHQTLAAVWRTYGKGAVKLQQTAILQTIADLYGNPLAYGNQTVSMNGEPSYWYFKDVSIEQIRELFTTAIIQHNQLVVPLTVELSHRATADSPTLNVSLFNPANTRQEGKICVSLPSVGNQQTATRSFKLQPREQITLSMPIPTGWLSGLKLDNIANLTFTQNGKTTTSTKIVQSQTTPRLIQSITIDGKLDDWNHPRWLVAQEKQYLQLNRSWQGPADLSGSVATAWDESNLYLSARVYDDEFTPATAGNSIWKGDAIQIAICNPMSSSDRYGVNDLEFVIAQTNQGPQVFAYWLGKGVKRAMDWPVKVTVIPRRAPLPTIIEYELAIPMSAINFLAPMPGKSFGLNFVIVDNDDSKLKGGIGIRPGIFGAKEPQKAWLMYLEK